MFHFYDAHGSEGGPLTEEGLSKHMLTPSVTLRRSNVVTLARSGGTEEISTWPKEALIKTHGKSVKLFFSLHYKYVVKILSSYWYILLFCVYCVVSRSA